MELEGSFLLNSNSIMHNTVDLGIYIAFKLASRKKQRISDVQFDF